MCRNAAALHFRSPLCPPRHGLGSEETREANGFLDSSLHALRAEMADLQQERAQIMAEAGRPGVRNNSNYILNSFSGCKRALSRFVLFRWLCLGTASDLGEGLGESCHCKFPWSDDERFLVPSKCVPFLSVFCTTLKDMEAKHQICQ